jgi:hemin uptake protein HemP
MNTNEQAQASYGIRLVGNGGAIDEASPPVRTVGSGDILAGQREVQIAHNGDRYRLRLTSKNKLILTK